MLGRHAMARLLGNAYGALGLGLGHDEELLPAFEQAMGAGRSAVIIEVMTDYEYAPPTATLSELSGKTLQGK